jgi:LPPG:FO 2-phospho-L-lactate transferase
VLSAILDTDLVILPPSNPVVSIGTILQVPGVADAVRSTTAPVVGVSPIIGGAPVRGMADACLRTIGVDTTAAGVGAHYGSRHQGGLLDAWIIDEADAADAPLVEAAGLRCTVAPTLMTDVSAAGSLARVCLTTAGLA